MGVLSAVIKKFQTNDRLPYPLLSDSGNRVLNTFGVPKQFFMTGRKTFVVDKTGKIVFTYNSSLKAAGMPKKRWPTCKSIPERACPLHPLSA